MRHMKYVIISVITIASLVQGQNWQEEWVRHFESDSGSAYPFAVATDTNGDIIVVGRTYMGEFTGVIDALIMKYNTDGDTIWSRIWRRPSTEEDTLSEGCAHVIVDDQNNSYVLVWTNLRIDDEYASTDITILKYDPDGNCIDTVHWDGPGDSDDMGNLLVRDPSDGAIYVGGRRKQYDSGSIMDRWLVIKFDANLDTLWSHDLPAPALMGAQIYDMVLDDSGNLCATGYTSNPGTIYDWQTIKYSSNGTVLAQATFDPGLGYQLDMATCLCLDYAGNIVVSGFINTSPGAQIDHDFYTIKYDSDLDSLWQRQYTFSSHSDGAGDIICDSLGDIYITGLVQLNSQDKDLWTMKYTSNGDLVWTDQYSGPGYRDDAGAWLALDSTESELYVVGQSSEGPTIYDVDYLFLVYNPETGDTLQSLKYNGAGNLEDKVQGAVIDKDGNLFVTGYTIEVLDSSAYAITTIKYSKQTSIGTYDKQNIMSKYLEIIPNPMTEKSVIKYEILNKGRVSIIIYDVLGRQVRQLFVGKRTPGPYAVNWDGRDEQNEILPAGVYYCKLSTNANFQTKKILLIK